MCMYKKACFVKRRRCSDHTKSIEFNYIVLNLLWFGVVIFYQCLESVADALILFAC